MADTRFQDFSFRVTAALDEISLAWLEEVAGEIAAQAARNCKMAQEGERIGVLLKESYRYTVDDNEGEARIGSSRESAFWEEFGTGSYADQSANGGKQGRQGWWVYVKNGTMHRMNGGTTYNTQEEAEAVAESMRAEGLDAYATNGREPNYTLQKAFEKVKPGAKELLQEKLKARLGE